MAACAEIVTQASLEEQQDELIALQSIFQEEIQLINAGEQISFDLTIKVNVPYDKIHLEAFIPVEVEEVVRRSPDSSGSDDVDGPSKDRQDIDETLASDGKDSMNEVQSKDLMENAHGRVAAGGKENNFASDNSPQASGTSCGKPSISRSLSLEHWHIQADIEYLTPINLKCSFPLLYPAECPPEFSLSCLWLTKKQLKSLQVQLGTLWWETCGLPIVFTWADWLQKNAYEYLGLQRHLLCKETELGNSHGVNETNLDACYDSGEQMDRENETYPINLQTALLTIFEYDLHMQRQAFQQSRHLCEICFDEREGTEFFYFDECRHFFCTDCLKVHCEMHVDSGTVLKLFCPSHDCKTDIPHDVLQSVLDAEKFERWERLLLSKTLDIMGDVVYCPRCNVAVILEEGDASSRLGQCANCFFAFCTECYEPWHHNQPCFEESSSDSDEPNEHEKNNETVKEKKSYDKESVLKAATKRQERIRRERDRRVNLSSLSFIKMMHNMGKYQYCPKCRMAVERISGCDMMHCSQCSASFCWRCGKAISGYGHFGQCGRPDPVQAHRVREPTLGETLLIEYKKQNPKRKPRTKLCSRCHQKCLKENNNNNHLKCWACRTDFCYQCGKEIKGAITSHYMATSPCTQHSED